MPVVLGDNTISIDGKVIETVKYVGTYHDPLETGEPIVTAGGSVTPVIIDADYKYLAFTYSGTGTQKEYTVNFPEDTECDILVVGGGGGGDRIIGGGGGGGAVLYATGISIPTNTYTIKVGKGGPQNTNGSPSEVFGATCLGGGSTAFVDWVSPYPANNGTAGGSGSGGSSGSATNGNGGGVGISQKGALLSSGILYNGNIGGNGVSQLPGDTAVGSGGGGGALTAGVSSSLTTYTLRSDWITAGKPGSGGNGVPIDITGTEYYWGAGGGGGTYQTHAGDGGLGGGGGGGATGQPPGLAGTGGINIGENGNLSGENGGNGVNSTGSGGGGGGFPAGTGGNGGSGIVIIRYPRTKIPFDAQWTYSALNTNVYHMGNVGIGTTNPTNALHVIGNTQSTTYSASSKTFKIEHPLKLNKWLYHGCIEGPRFDNIYRGKKLITNGKADVDIDTECNTTGGMTPGTFPILNTNTQLFLRNNQTYDRVKGKINGSIISIECENATDDIEIDWMVVGERHDEHVINTPLTDSDGNLICEHEML
jgi:hypothetical protein